MNPLPLRSVLTQAVQQLRAAETDAPQVTAEVLLAQVLGLSRAQLLARLEQPISSEKQAVFAGRLARAARGEPLAYLTGRREFHGLDFEVDARVLVPRPETELLADRALAYLNDFPAPRVLDVGTGSGCIAVTLAVKYPAARVTATDLSRAALAVARRNAERHGAAGRITLVCADLLAGLALDVDLLCANLPYIPAETARALPVAAHEPRLALAGGPDGLAVIRRLLAEAPRVMRPAGRLLLEIEASQGPAALVLAQAAFPAARVQVLPDLAGLDRIVAIELE